MAEQKQELYQRHWAELHKYMYYVIGLSVASIAFAVHSSMDIILTCRTIPLGVAIILWGVSIAAGLSYLNHARIMLAKNIVVLEYKEFQTRFGETRAPELSKLEEDLKKIGARNNWRYRFCLWGLALGACSFIVWRILEMLPCGPTCI